MDKLQQLYLEQLHGKTPETILKEIARTIHGNLGALRMNYMKLQRQLNDMDMPILADHYSEREQQAADLLGDLENYVGRYFPYLK